MRTTLTLGSLAAMVLVTAACSSTPATYRINCNAANAEMTIYENGQRVGVHPLGADLADVEDDWTFVIAAPGYETWHGGLKDMRPEGEKSYTAKLEKKK
jgi:hypothetical protein